MSVLNMPINNLWTTYEWLVYAGRPPDEYIALEVSDDAPYKSTFYLLTYLLT